MYKDDLERLAKISYDRFVKYIYENNYLYTNKEEIENGEVEIEVLYMDENEEELIGRFYFNQDEKFLGTDIY